MLNSGYRRRASSEVELSISEHMLDAIIMIDGSFVFSAKKSYKQSYEFP